jgi:hypothetical protein
MKEMRNTYKISVGKPEGKGPVERTRRRWKFNIKRILKKDVRVWAGFIWLGIGTTGGLF